MVNVTAPGRHENIAQLTPCHEYTLMFIDQLFPGIVPALTHTQKPEFGQLDRYCNLSKEAMLVFGLKWLQVLVFKVSWRQCLIRTGYRQRKGGYCCSDKSP